MTVTATIQTTRIEDMQIGHRYTDVRPGYEAKWAVASIERRESGAQTIVDGSWTWLTDMITVTYRNGIALQHPVGTELAIYCDIEEPRDH